MTFVFVILHYMVYKDTIECVNSIISNVIIAKEDMYYIVVVDNGSDNDSYSILKKELKDKRVILLQNDKNWGFARGNNIGFKFAKNSLKADFIALINNDTIISQKDWIIKAMELYREYKYAVLGPDIITADGYHQNPFPQKKWTLISLHMMRRKQQIKMLLTRFGLDAVWIERKCTSDCQKFVDRDVLNAGLHGACMIFSKEYIECFDGLCDKTFLYMEEEILMLYLDAYHLKSLYSPEIKIFHKEDMATNAAITDTKERKIRKYKYWIDSSRVYEKVYLKLLKGKKNV